MDTWLKTCALFVIKIAESFASVHRVNWHLANLAQSAENQPPKLPLWESPAKIQPVLLALRT